MSPVVWSRLGIEAAKEITTAMDYLRWHANGGVHTASNPLSNDAYVDVFESVDGDILTRYRWAPRRFHNTARNYADLIKELKDRGMIKIPLNAENLLMGFALSLSVNESNDNLDQSVLRFIDITTALSQDRHQYSSGLEDLNKAAKRFNPASFTKLLREAVSKHDGFGALGSDSTRSWRFVLVNWVTDLTEKLDSEFKPNSIAGALFALSHRGEGRLVERFLNIFQRMDSIERGVEIRAQKGTLAQVSVDKVYRPAMEALVYVTASYEELTDVRRELIERAVRIFEGNDIGAFEPKTQTYDECRLNIFMLLTAILSYSQISEEAKKNAAELTQRLLEDGGSYENVSNALKKLLGSYASPAPAPRGPRRASSRPAGRHVSSRTGPASRRAAAGFRLRPAVGMRYRHSL